MQDLQFADKNGSGPMSENINLYLQVLFFQLVETVCIYKHIYKIPEFSAATQPVADTLPSIFFWGGHADHRSLGQSFVENV